MKPINARVHASLRVMLADRRRITTGTVAEHAGVSAPTAYTALRALVAEGKLEHVGAGRGAHFRPILPSLATITESREGLSEDDVWRRLSLLPAIKALQPNINDILHIAVSEMVNNAVDHSRGSTVAVEVFRVDASIGFEVKDDGVGVFETVMEKFALKTPFEAIAELQKGKVTTIPERHAGEGLFFTSKMADLMWIEGNSTRWVIDNTQRDTQAVVQVASAPGSRVRFEIALISARSAEHVYQSFTDEDLAFTKTRTAIRLFREGNQIVSRSEAKRLLVGLEKFREVELDFAGVDGIGQGFADEVFRVWQRDHPQTKLLVTHVNRAVRFMIGRARATQVTPPTGTPSAQDFGNVTVANGLTATAAPSTTIIRTSTGE